MRGRQGAGWREWWMAIKEEGTVGRQKILPSRASDGSKAKHFKLQKAGDAFKDITEDTHTCAPSPPTYGWRMKGRTRREAAYGHWEGTRRTTQQWLTLGMVFANTHTINVHFSIDIALLYRHNQIDGSGSGISKQPWGGWVAENTVFLHYAGSLWLSYSTNLCSTLSSITLVSLSLSPRCLCRCTVCPVQWQRHTHGHQFTCAMHSEQAAEISQ